MVKYSGFIKERCPRCGGNQMVERIKFGYETTCIACGRMEFFTNDMEKDKPFVPHLTPNGHLSREGQHGRAQR